MSVPVELHELAAQVAVFGATPYLLTVSDDGRAHAVSVAISWDSDGRLSCSAGRRTAANAAARSSVSLLWPPTESGGYSLIVDGNAAVAADGIVAITPAKAVLHRSAPSPDPASACTSDCVPIALS